MKPRSLLVLALVVAALGAFIWFFERDLPSTDERSERAKKLLPLDGEEVTAVEIRRDGAVTRLERQPETAETAAADELAVPPEPEWRLVEPLVARADGDAVGDLLATLTGLDKERTLEDVDRAAVGLESPRATVSLRAGEQEWVVEVGEEVPASSNVIVGLGGRDEAFVVPGSFWSDLGKPAGDWRSREVLRARRDDVAAVRLGAAGREVVLRRGEDGFVVERPYRDEADRDRVDELLAALTGLEVDRFLDGPQDRAALGLEPAAAEIEVTLAGGEPVRVALGAPVDGEAEDGEAEDEAAGRHVAVGDQVFTAETRLGELAQRPPGDWRSSAWTRLEVYEIDRVEVRRGGEPVLELERVEGDWRRQGEEIPYTAASDLLYALADARAAKVLDPAAADLAGEPLYEIELATADGGEVLRLHPAGADGHPATRDGRDSVLVLPPAAVDELTAKLEAAQRAEPVPAPEGEPAADDGSP